MNKYITIGIEKLIAMCVIAFGEWNGCQWQYFPRIPKCFSDGLDFQNSCGCHADLLRLTVNELGRVEIWFADEDGDTFYYDWEEIRKTHPFLCVSIATHIFDMIENVKES